MNTSKTSSGAEKRRYPRIPVGIVMDIPLQDGSRRRATIADLSMSGMSMTSDAVLEEGMLLHLRLDLPLEIRGEVRSARISSSGMHRYGIHFHSIKSASSWPQRIS